MANQFRKSRQKLKAAGLEKNRRKAEVISVTAAVPPVKASRGDESPAAVPVGAATRVGVGLEKGWNKRNFLTEVLLPSLLARRDGTPNHAPLFPALADTQVGITWIGHASFLVQMAGMNILIDPIWSLWLKGIKRLKTPGLNLHELPMIDLVLVTHAHFDHLDRRTLRAVACNQPIVVPFGVGNLVHDLGFEGSTNSITGTFSSTVRCRYPDALPSLGCAGIARSAPGIRRLFTRGRGRSVFHCGDTAYFDGFKEIGRRCPTEIALLPIGAYDAPERARGPHEPRRGDTRFSGFGCQDSGADALRHLSSEL